MPLGNTIETLGFGPAGGAGGRGRRGQGGFGVGGGGGTGAAGSFGAQIVRERTWIVERQGLSPNPSTANIVDMPENATALPTVTVSFPRARVSVRLNQRPDAGAAVALGPCCGPHQGEGPW